MKINEDGYENIEWTVNDYLSGLEVLYWSLIDGEPTNTDLLINMVERLNEDISRLSDSISLDYDVNNPQYVLGLLHAFRWMKDSIELWGEEE